MCGWACSSGWRADRPPLSRSHTDIGANADGTLLLLESLAALDQVEREPGTYSLSRAGRRVARPCIGHIHRHAHRELPRLLGVVGEYRRTSSGRERGSRSTTSRRTTRTGAATSGGSSSSRGCRRRTWPAHCACRRVRGACSTSRARTAGSRRSSVAAIPTLHATVIDLPASAAVGREIIAEQGMTDRVMHVDGDMMSADLGGPYDGALCFNIVHHLSPEQNMELLRRIQDSLSPGGTVAVLDLFMPPAGHARRCRRDAGPLLLSDLLRGHLHGGPAAGVVAAGRLRPPAPHQPPAPAEPRPCSRHGGRRRSTLQAALARVAAKRAGDLTRLSTAAQVVELLVRALLSPGARRPAALRSWPRGARHAAPARESDRRPQTRRGLWGPGRAWAPQPDHTIEHW